MTTTLLRPSLNRREILTYFLLGSLLLLGLNVAGLFVIYALPQPDSLTIGPVADYPPAAYPYIVRSNDGPSFWLVNLGPELRAFHPVSPDHWHCRYTWSGVNGRFEDPCSASKFTLDGTYIQGPATRNLDQYPVRIHKGERQVELSRLIPGEAAKQVMPVGGCGYKVYYAEKRPGIVLPGSQPSPVVPGKVLVRESLPCP